MAGPIAATSNAALGARDPQGPCQSEYEVSILSCERWRYSWRWIEGSGTFSGDLMNYPG